MSIRRPPSYSDSHLYLSDIPLTPLLLTSEVPTLRPVLQLAPEPIILEESNKECLKDWIFRKVLVLGVKGSIHLTLISMFETIFFFVYVSKTENSGILKTLDIYYEPFLTICDEWTPNFRSELLDVLEILGVANQSVVDAAGAAALAVRTEENLKLLWISLGYTAGCIVLGGGCISILVWSKREVKWRELIGEHFFFVIVLGLYEWFFFRTIIYEYNTLSTPELNQYLSDGLYSCLSTGPHFGPANQSLVPV